MANFYKTKKWKQKREAILRRDTYRCRQCKRYGRVTPANTVHHVYPLEDYPELKLSNDNLISLCDTCHENMHNRFNGELTDLGKEWTARLSHLVIQQTDIADANVSVPLNTHNTHRVIIVWGPPGSGKTTYVKKKMIPGDIAVDLDYLKRAITLQDGKEFSESILPVAFELRDTLYSLIATRSIPECTAWVIAGLPRRKAREELASMLQADDLIYMDVDKQECIRRALADDEREDKELQRNIIDKWFKDHYLDNK